MEIYKFKDLTDGNYCFILAKNKKEAVLRLNKITSINFILKEIKKVEDLKTPLIIFNKILPF